MRYIIGGVPSSHRGPSSLDLLMHRVLISTLTFDKLLCGNTHGRGESLPPTTHCRGYKPPRPPVTAAVPPGCQLFRKLHPRLWLPQGTVGHAVPCRNFLVSDKSCRRETLWGRCWRRSRPCRGRHPYDSSRDLWRQSATRPRRGGCFESRRSRCVPTRK